MSAFIVNETHQNKFTKLDHEIVHAGIFEVLSNEEFKLVVLVFWKNIPLHTVSEYTSVPISRLQTTLNKALSKLKAYCLEYPEFSRSIPISLLSA